MIIIIALFIQLITQKSIEEETGAVVLNLKKANISYQIENPGKTQVNLTLYKNNQITNSSILSPNEKISISKENIKALGELHE